MEVMRKLAGWVSLMLCMCGLQAELNIHFHPPAPEYFKAPCVFPFTYDDLTYYSCISVHSDYAWCSLDERFHGRWRYCTAKVYSKSWCSRTDRS
ncbi:PREDICTED: binder of sperm protein homolog 1 isoform X3 [Myotis brandtii]|uniref:binder of sperm protein homolog 1 isoform X3 n=1 Tax=Myotis brandtii TaxID=109478 RepID=UPI0007045664|nr:PREDICTED: binder of sperm protein homolog 1 isoform X3 [Myotis brandtii]